MENGQKDILKRTFNFSVNTIKAIRNTRQDSSLMIIFRQLIRSSTSVGANLEEAQDAHSKKEFVQKISISLKEARESNYWLRLVLNLEDSPTKFITLEQESLELVKILTSIVKNSKKN